MASLKKHLTKKGFECITMKRTKTNHFKVNAKINGIKGKFIVDTGASNTCIGFDDVHFFDLDTKESETKAAGAGAIDMETKMAQIEKIKIGTFKAKSIDIVVFDLSHVNTALINHKAKPVNGIIGADILQKGKAIIDYENNRLFLKN